MSELHPTDEELMQSVDRLGSPEAGLKLPAEFLSPVSDAIGLARKQAATIAELQKRSGDISAAIGSTRFMDPPDGGDVSLAEQVKRMREALEAAEQALTVERQRREEAEAKLRTILDAR